MYHPYNFHFHRFLFQFLLVHCRRLISKDIDNSFTKRDDFSFLILDLQDEYFLLYKFYSWNVSLYHFFVSTSLCMSYCLFILFLFRNFLMHLLTSFSRCFFSFGCTSSLLNESSYFHVFFLLKSPQSHLLLLSRLLLLRHVLTDIEDDRVSLIDQMCVLCVMNSTHDTI